MTLKGKVENDQQQRRQKRHMEYLGPRMKAVATAIVMMKCSMVQVISLMTTHSGRHVLVEFNPIPVDFHHHGLNHFHDLNVVMDDINNIHIGRYRLRYQQRRRRLFSVP
jgi:hypothetical protein